MIKFYDMYKMNRYFSQRLIYYTAMLEMIKTITQGGN